MKIAGIQPQSLQDFPGKISAILFTAGCNFRCSFCHNHNIIVPELLAKQKVIEFDSLMDFFDERKNFLTGVTITGGEPTLWHDLDQIIDKLKSFGYAIKLDTNGTNPEILQKLIDKLDYVAMDIKSALSFDRYNKAVGYVLNNNMFENVKKSIKILMSSNIDYEFRTTFVPSLLNFDDIKNIAKFIDGANQYCLQKFMPENAYDKNLNKSYTSKEMHELKKWIENNTKIKRIIIR